MVFGRTSLQVCSLRLIEVLATFLACLFICQCIQNRGLDWMCLGLLLSRSSARKANRHWKCTDQAIGEGGHDLSVESRSWPMQPLCWSSRCLIRLLKVSICLIALCSSTYGFLRSRLHRMRPVLSTLSEQWSCWTLWLIPQQINNSFLPICNLGLLSQTGSVSPLSSESRVWSEFRSAVTASMLFPAEHLLELLLKMIFWRGFGSSGWWAFGTLEWLGMSIGLTSSSNPVTD